MPSLFQKAVIITLFPDELAFALTGFVPFLVAITLTVLCLQDSTGKAKFYLLLQFTRESLQDLDTICLKFPLKGLLCSITDLGAIVFGVYEKEYFLNFTFQIKLCDMSKVLAVNSSLNCWLSSRNLEFFFI